MESHLEFRLCRSEGRAARRGKMNTQKLQKGTLYTVRRQGCFNLWGKSEKLKGILSRSTMGLRGPRITEAGRCFTSFRLYCSKYSHQRHFSCNNSLSSREISLDLRFTRSIFVVYKSLDLRKIRSHSHANVYIFQLQIPFLHSKQKLLAYTNELSPTFFF